MGSLLGHGGIFISYRRDDSASQAGRLYDHLSARYGEDRVFMDIDSIAIGTDFTKALIEAVSRCSILLALIGRQWSVITDIKGIRRIDYPNDFVRVEIETALQRDIRVVPVLVDGSVLPQADDLPAGLRPLIKRQAFQLSSTGFRSEVSRLIAAADEILDAKSGRSGEALGVTKASQELPRVAGRWRDNSVTGYMYNRTEQQSPQSRPTPRAILCRKDKEPSKAQRSRIWPVAPMVR